MIRGCQRSMNNTTQIQAGKYSIGSNSIPNASPVHRRQMNSYWIDRSPVTFGHFERFVADGGYDNETFWIDSGYFRPPSSVDHRCDELFEQSTRSAKLFHDVPARSGDIPLVGVSWNEAAAIARYAGGRLPFETEWEVAMMRTSDEQKVLYQEADEGMIPACWARSKRSVWGCIITTSVLQEWTADAFSPRYWRADGERHGSFWTPVQSYGVSLRGGCKSDIYQDTHFRRAADPREIHSARSFRRVWQSQPDEQASSTHFACFEGVSSYA